MVAGGFGIEENLWKEKEKARFKKCKYEIEKEKKKIVYLLKYVYIGVHYIMTIHYSILSFGMVGLNLIDSYSQ